MALSGWLIAARLSRGWPAILASGPPPRGISRRPGRQLNLVAIALHDRYLARGRGDDFFDLGRQGGDDIASQLSVLALVFLDEATLLVFGEGVPPDAFDLVRDVHEDFFGAAVAVEGVGDRVADVATGDVCGAVDGEGDAVGHFLAPALSRS